MKKRKIVTAVLAGVMVVGLTTAAFAESPIKLFYNGTEIQAGVSPVNINGRIYTPVRALAEAMGASVSWDLESRQVCVTGNDQSVQIRMLEHALAPESALDAVNTWADGVQARNGAQQYAVMTQDLKKAKLDDFVSCNWVTGVSSPWVKDFTVKALNDAKEETGLYRVTFTWTDSTNEASESCQYISVRSVDGIWLVDSIRNLDLKGKITELKTSGENLIDGIHVKGSKNGAAYEEGTALLEDGTKIYKGYTSTELGAEALKEGVEVEVTYKDGPMLMIYPPQAVAAEIRVF